MIGPNLSNVNMNWGNVGRGVGTVAAGLGGAIIEGEYQKSLQEDAQKFTKEQSQNQIKYNVQQLKDLGISPMMLFGGSPTAGGAGGSSQGKAPNFSGAILQAINTVGNLWMRDKELDNKEKNLANNERYIDLLEKKAANENAANAEKLAKTGRSYAKHDYSKYDFNSVFTNLDDIEI